MPRPMRIAFVALCLPPDVGGSERFNLEIARRLHARKHLVRVFTWGKGNLDERKVDAALPFEVHRGPWQQLGNAIHPRGLEGWLGGAEQDVVLVSRASKLLRHVVRVAARHGPLVVAAHDLGARHTRRGAFGRWRSRRRYGLDRARRIVAISEDTRKRVEALRVDVPVDVVHPGADTHWFKPDPRLRDDARRALGLEGRKVLLTVSRLAANKRHARVIEAVCALREGIPDLTYVIVGDGEERRALAALVRERALDDIVRFTGTVEDTRPWYAASDVFVMPSGRERTGKAGEGFGIAYVEAGACGLPVIASASGGGSEIVVDGETGLLIDPDDARALENSLATLLADPEKARRLGEAARHRCERFDWERGVDAMVAALEQAALPR